MNTIAIEKDERGVAVLALTREDKHNAMSAEMIAELTAAAASLGADDSVRVVVLTGAGSSFCAGGDLGWMKAQMSASRAARMDGARALAQMLRALNEMPKPLIGRVQGHAFGGGVGLISVCDVAIAAEGAKFGLTETRLGLIPATISPYVIARMGEAMARRVFMSAKIFEAAEAKVLGLVAKSVIPEHLDLAVEAEVKPYLKAAPSAVAAAKALARSLGPVIDDAVIERTVEALADTWETPAAMEGISAFFEKRNPVWP
ncbi:MAG: crotonase/enoyl-CoA hydratase family protein [Rhodobacteraceae bacterium]|nr:crotonase/enoyl-CoA hydratase family protein [Paracoccaceae bacterium]